MDQLLYTGLVGDGSSSSNNSNFYADTQMIMSDELKSQIANHPLYPNLLSASIECTKVGVPPEMASLLEEISKENLPFFGCSQIGSAADPELDQFMISYCEVLHKYKDEVSKTFEEATRFLSGIESQLARLCKSQTPPPPATACSYYHYSDAEEDFCFGGLEANGIGEYIGTRQVDEELKEQLMRKYSGYLCSLRGEFSKKRKKGKLPKDATTALLEWWNAHYIWPYPTEDEKNELSGITGLDLKQINNWFINQRKRHWRPTEDMQLALMEGASGMYFDATGGVDI